MYELNIYQLAITLGCSFIYVLMFRVQRVIDPIYYFGFSELVYGYKTSISLKFFIIKALYIFIFSILVYIVVRNEFIAVVSVFLGSLLIVWPVIIDKRKEDYALAERRKLLIAVYIIFILSSTSISYFGLSVFKTFYPYFNITRIIDIGVSFIITLIFTPLLYKILKILDKEVKIKRSYNLEDD